MTLPGLCGAWGGSMPAEPGVGVALAAVCERVAGLTNLGV